MSLGRHAAVERKSTKKSAAAVRAMGAASTVTVLNNHKQGPLGASAKFRFCQNPRCEQLLYPDVIPTAVVGKTTTATMSNATVHDTAATTISRSLVWYCKSCKRSELVEDVSTHSIYLP